MRYHLVRIAINITVILNPKTIVNVCAGHFDHLFNVDLLTVNQNADWRADPIIDSLEPSSLLGYQFIRGDILTAGQAK